MQSTLQPLARQKIVDRRQAEFECSHAPAARARRLQSGYLHPECVDLLCFVLVDSRVARSRELRTYREHKRQSRVKKGPYYRGNRFW